MTKSSDRPHSAALLRFSLAFLLLMAAGCGTSDNSSDEIAALNRRIEVLEQQLNATTTRPTTAATATTSTTPEATSTTLLATTTTEPRPADFVLHGWGIGDWRYGSAAEDVISAVSEVLGPRTLDEISYCGGGNMRLVGWPGFMLILGVDANEWGNLTLTDSRFIGWSLTGRSAWDLGTGFAPGWKTDEGIGLGSTGADVATAYPDSVFWPESPDAEWAPPFFNIGRPFDDDGYIIIMDGKQASAAVISIESGLSLTLCD